MAGSRDRIPKRGLKTFIPCYRTPGPQKGFRRVSQGVSDGVSEGGFEGVKKKGSAEGPFKTP